MTGLKISKTLELPLEAATWTFGVLAIKGAGKTYGSGVDAEEMVKAGIPIIAIDPMGIWWGLRVGVDNHQGLPIVVFGGQHADLPIPVIGDTRKFGKIALDEARLCLMVKAILESGINGVLDLTGFSKGMKHKIVAVFVSELMRLYEMNASLYGARHIFLEEANKYCPQREVKGDVAVSTGAIESLVMSGGNYNLGCTLITQRSAALNKNVLSQSSCLIVLRILDPRDKNAVKAWVESMADPRDPKIIKWFDGLRDLKNGEAWVWHPEKPVIFQKIMFRKRETLHATREYFTATTAKTIKALDVTEFIAKFNKVFAPKPKPSEPHMVVETKTGITTVPIPPTRAPMIGLPNIIMIPPPTSSARGQIANRLPGAPLDMKGHPLPLGEEGKFLHPSDLHSNRDDRYTVPDWTLRKWRPEFVVPISLIDNPPLPIVRVLVVLANSDPKTWRDDRWTVKKIKGLVKDHCWSDDGVDEAIQQLLRAETLAWKSGYLRFFRDHVKLEEYAQPAIFKTEVA